LKPLTKDLRSKFENTIVNAREIAEEAAMISLEQLGVEKSSPYSYLSETQRELRRKLRAHGRQLGDIRDSKTEEQEIERLIEEVAYEYWHRMLFARFLAENNLLMYYEDDDLENAVPVSLSECEEMAPEMDFTNGWELAAKFATKMLPQVFRPESPVFELHFSPEKQKELEKLLTELDTEVFTASDSLGWAYQFWQSKKKDLVNKSEVKIGERQLPAVTQLFTEPYMVNFLLDNSLGAWWAKKRLSKSNLENAKTEEELRSNISLPGVKLEYLRFVKDDANCWKTAGGKFEGWPMRLSELKILDPCCGSGHFLVSAFLMLVPMRMELECLSAKDACDAVIRENIRGLEIDQRCVELAAFAVALTAWKYPKSSGFRRLPNLQIAWCGQSVNVKKEEWLALAEGNAGVKMHLETLFNIFQNAPVLGSLMNPREAFEAGSMFEKDWELINNLMERTLEKKKSEYDGLSIVAQGMEKAFTLLNEQYHLVLTNVPYLLRGKQNSKLQNFCKANYDVSKNDLATVFLERCLNFCSNDGTVSIVMPQNWLFLTSYKKIREKLLKTKKWEFIASLGSGAFDTISGEMVKVILLQMSKTDVPKLNDSTILGLDVSDSSEINVKRNRLKSDEIQSISAQRQLLNPDSRIIFQFDDTFELLTKYANTCHGLVSFDRPRFIFKYWELGKLINGWELMQSTPEKGKNFSGLKEILKWQNGTGELYRLVKDKEELDGYRSGVWKGGIQYWGKRGILHGVMSDLPATIYMGYPFDSNVAPLIPKKDADIVKIWAYSKSGKLAEEVRKLDKKIMVTNATLVKVPFDIDHWEKVANDQYLNKLPEPYTDDPTQWIFHGHPSKSEAPLQVAVARLLGYRWPAESDKEMELSDEANSLVAKCDELLSYSDVDGIVCIPSVRGEAPASERLLNLLAEAYKRQDVNAKVSELLASSDHSGKSLDSWLRDKFFMQHCKLFEHRPFIWHIWDGLKDGFSALVNYHKLDRKNLETLIYTYLGDWINKQKAEIASGVDGAEEKLTAAKSLKRSLELILKGEAPYDIFIRWKPIQNQPIGWEPDINDGVRMNIRPFILVTDMGKKGAGILRDKPNIKWDKDRGKDTKNSPWHKNFDGNRINDYHLTLEEKNKARQEMR
jgi:hypothetical protein